MDTPTFNTPHDDVAGLVESLRSLAYMLECNHVQYIGGGLQAVATRRDGRAQIQINMRLAVHIDTQADDAQHSQDTLELRGDTKG